MEDTCTEDDDGTAMMYQSDPDHETSSQLLNTAGIPPKQDVFSSNSLSTTLNHSSPSVAEHNSEAMDSCIGTSSNSSPSRSMTQDDLISIKPQPAVAIPDFLATASTSSLSPEDSSTDIKAEITIESVSSKCSVSPVESTTQEQGSSEMLEEAEMGTIDHLGHRIDNQGRCVLDSGSKDSTEKQDFSSVDKMTPVSDKTIEEEGENKITVDRDDNNDCNTHAVESDNIAMTKDKGSDNFINNDNETKECGNENVKDEIDTKNEADVTVDRREEGESSPQKQRHKRNKTIIVPRDRLERTSKHIAEVVTAHQAMSSRKRGERTKTVRELLQEKHPTADTLNLRQLLQEKEVYSVTHKSSQLPDLMKLCRPVSVKLYDIAEDLNGQTTILLRKGRGRRSKQVQNLLLIADNKPPVGQVERRSKRVVKLYETKSKGGKHFSYCMNSTDEEDYDLEQEEEERRNQEDFNRSFENFLTSDSASKSYDMSSTATTIVSNLDTELVKIEPIELHRMPEPKLNLSSCGICHVRHVPVDHADEHKEGDHPILCPICLISFQTELARSIHATIHLPPPPPRTILYCSLCRGAGKPLPPFKGSSCVEDFTAHCMAEHNPSESVFCCSLCTETFVERNLFTIHMDCHRPTHQSCTCQQSGCHVCCPNTSPGKKISTGGSQLVSVKEFKQCDKCQLSFKNIAFHKKMVHGLNPKLKHYRCPVCAVIFFHFEIAQLHMKIHVEAMPSTLPKYYTCSLCAMYTQYIVIHVKVQHSDVVPSIQCRYCDEKVAEANLLFMHVIKHWPSRCNCGKALCKMCSSSNAPSLSDCCRALKAAKVPLVQPSVPVVQPSAPEVQPSVSVVQPSVPVVQPSTPVVQPSSPEVIQSSSEIVLDPFLESPNKTECFICKLRFIDFGNQNKSIECQRFSDLAHHIKNEHQTSKYRCSLCKAGFCNRDVAQFHLHVHTGLHLPVRNVCSLCKESPDTDIADHVINKHQNIHRKYYLTCRVCSLILPEETLYRKHLLSHLPPDSGTGANDDADVIYISPNENASKLSVGHSRLNRACQVCYIFSDNMEEHAIEHRPTKARFRCRVCKVTFHTEVMSSTHARIHCYKYPNLILRCSLCLKSFGNANMLIEHSLTQHNMGHKDWRQGAVCNICQAVFPEENSLQAHKALHMPKYCRCGNKECKYCTYYTCKTCGEFFGPGLKHYYFQHSSHCNRYSQTQASQKAKPTSSAVIKIARVRPYQRSDSAKTSMVPAAKPSPSAYSSSSATFVPRRQAPTSSSILVVDSEDDDDPKTTGESPGSTECVSCGMQIKSGTIAEHFRQYHNKPVNMYACKEKNCRYAAPDVDTLVRHRLKHLGQNNFFRCLFCADYFHEWSLLLNHNYNVHFVKQHRCNVCAMYFTDINLLKKHNSVNSWKVIEKFPCKYCCRTFSSQLECDRHMMQHGNPCHHTGNVFGCLFCNKFVCACSAVFKANQFLQYMLHMRTCYRCYACDVVCESSEELSRHEVSHYHKCSVCGVKRKTRPALRSHMTMHYCMCPADNKDCLFCKKAWCTVCRTRFVKSELTSYFQHRVKCPHSDLLCICREDDCIICQHAKCPVCHHTFKKYRFVSFSSHVKVCMGESPDPFAPTTKRIRIKEEPIDVDFTRKRRVVDSTVIDLDNDDAALENRGQDEPAALPKFGMPTEVEEEEDKTSEISVYLDQNTIAIEKNPNHQISNELTSGTQVFDPWGSASTDLITVTPQEQGPQPSTSYSYSLPSQRQDSSGDHNVICVTPIADNTETQNRDIPQGTPHGIINICPENDMSELNVTQDMVMDYVVQPVAKINPADLGFLNVDHSVTHTESNR